MLRQHHDISLGKAVVDYSCQLCGCGGDLSLRLHIYRCTRSAGFGHLVQQCKIRSARFKRKDIDMVVNLDK